MPGPMMRRRVLLVVTAVVVGLAAFAGARLLTAGHATQHGKSALLSAAETHVRAASADFGRTRHALTGNPLLALARVALLLRVLVWGKVTQFDAATGDDTFRADAGPSKHAKDYGYVFYDDNVVFNGDTSRLADVVEGDRFVAKIEVAGALSYYTQIGGNTTVPQMKVVSINVYDSTK